ncbi:F0F1 ATP synthase subunit gamma [Mycolicibacterium fallax]|uniref:ATP synthase gamma chain n=1 Tax=Mycolicibacterium fallax TaxID=1793 RepID=A0A1X1R841_MYCFA|nr:F0F1 ATP synthase subunit gamma [Mycolicibacterium fallax]ORV01003.1 ATP synthase F0F1 subunit gamma [Mycolicibacterium fallax]BBY96564.1 ATP synthase gamma chain [Mycolicibacterium fallax]
MAATLRELRGRIRSAGAIKKITKAQELIATSRIVKAQARVEQARPYSSEITHMLTLLAGHSALDHPLLVERPEATRAAVLVVSSDRGLCGGYNANVLRHAEELLTLLREQGKEADLYVVGRKALGFYSFRNRAVIQSWIGFSERPTFAHAQEIAETLVGAFLAGEEGEHSVDELHIVFTEFKTMLTQSAEARRIAPLVVEYVEDQTPVAEGPTTLFTFEPDATTLFEELLPRYVATRVYAALLEAAASESASRRRAMKSATDNADDLIKLLTLEANRERQAQITQEISEIVGGANALADAKD